MKRPRIVLSDAAVADILEESDWYQEQSGDKLAKRGFCWYDVYSLTCLIQYSILRHTAV